MVTFRSQLAGLQCESQHLVVTIRRLVHWLCSLWSSVSVARYESFFVMNVYRPCRNLQQNMHTYTFITHALLFTNTYSFEPAVLLRQQKSSNPPLPQMVLFFMSHFCCCWQCSIYWVKRHSPQPALVGKHAPPLWILSPRGTIICESKHYNMRIYSLHDEHLESECT